MAKRNLKKEAEWAKKKYDLIRFSVPKQVGQNLRDTLNEDGKTIAQWGKEQIDKYLTENET